MTLSTVIDTRTGPWRSDLRQSTAGASPDKFPVEIRTALNYIALRLDALNLGYLENLRSACRTRTRP